MLVPTTSYRIGDFLAAAERLGVDVAVGSNQRQVLEQYSEGRTVTLDFKDVERGVAQIELYSREFPLAAIVGVDDETTVIAAKASKARRPTMTIRSNICSSPARTTTYCSSRTKEKFTGRRFTTCRNFRARRKAERS